MACFIIGKPRIRFAQILIIGIDEQIFSPACCAKDKAEYDYYDTQYTAVTAFRIQNELP
jgi:hypothetical protein